jgi:hypothetical protein
MSTTKRPTLSFTHAIFRGLQEDLRTSLKELPFSTPSVLRNGLLEAHRKLSDYYYKMDQSPYYTWAARTCITLSLTFDYLTRSQVLDPRISYEGLKSDFYHDDDLLQELETAKTALDNHFKANYAARNHNIVPVTPPLTASSSCELGSPQKDFTARYQVHRRVVLDELREYYSLPREDFKHCDPVQWWFARKAQFPNLIFSALLTIF